MLLSKPKFWDKKKDYFYSIILIPFTFFILLNNWISPFFSKQKFKIKTICVGNIYIGGTGKTPSAIEIFKILKKLKMRPVFIKKFYANHLDEYKLLSKTGPVISLNSRKKSIKLAETKKFKIAIIDDGLQDKSIDYDLKIVCFDKKNFIGNGKLIPAGPLREKLNSIKNYDIVFFNGPNKIEKKFISLIKKINKNIKIFETYPKLVNTKNLKKRNKYLSFSGIGNPNNFIFMLKKNNFKVIKSLNFADHYNYSDNDIKKIKNLAKNLNSQILTTEKDFLRLSTKNKKDIKKLSIELEIKNNKKFIKVLKKI